MLGAGAMTAVGDDVDSTCAAMRVRFNNHQELNYVGYDGEPVIGSLAAIHPALVDESRLIEMAAQAVREASAGMEAAALAKIPWLLCTPEQSRCGRADSDAELLRSIASHLGINPSHPMNTIIAKGRSAVFVALQHVQSWFAEGEESLALIIAVDSLIGEEALAEFDDEGVLLTTENSSGFIPGEAGIALLVGRIGKSTVADMNVTAPLLLVESVATMDDDPEELRKAAEQQRKLPVDGRRLAAVINQACRNADCLPASIDLRVADANGTEFGFKESALAEVHVFTDEDAELPDMWLPAEGLGEIGAAFGAAAIAWIAHAARKRYLPGSRVLLHATNLEGQRAAAILKCHFEVSGDSVHGT